MFLEQIDPSGYLFWRIWYIFIRDLFPPNSLTIPLDFSMARMKSLELLCFKPSRGSVKVTFTEERILIAVGHDYCEGQRGMPYS